MAKNSDPATTNTAREDLKRKTPDSSVYSVRSIQEDVDDPAKALDPFAPSSEELLTLRRVPGRLPWTAYTLAFVEMCERLSFCGTVAVFVNFIQQPMPESSITGAGFKGQSGALGMGQMAATAITTFDALWVYLLPLLAAYLADAHWGRFKTIMVACAAAIAGHVILVICSVPVILTAPKVSLALLLIAIIVMGMGTGGFKACVGTMMAEQSDGTPPRIKVLKSGERVIVDNELTVSRSYMYFYLLLNIGAAVGQICMIYSEKFVGFWLSFTIPLVMFLSCPVVLFLSKNHYVRSQPSGSVLSKAFRLWKLATRGKWSLNPIKTYQNLSSPTLWEAVKPSSIPPEHRPSWMTFDDSWVAEVQRGLKACKVLSWYPILWLGYNQMLHNLTSQAATMETHGLPNDFYSNINPFTLIIAIPIFDQLIYPFLRARGIAFTPLKRIASGFVCATAALVWAAVLQLYIYRLGPCGFRANGCKAGPAPISAWWQAGPLGLIALSEMLAVTTGMEYCFAKAPTNMRSLVFAVYLFMTAIASAVGQALVPLSDDPVLVWNYTVIAAVLFSGTCGFWWMFAGLDREEVLEWRRKGEKEIRAVQEGGQAPNFRSGEGDLEK